MFLKLEKDVAKVGLHCNEVKTAYTMVKKRESFSPMTIVNTDKYIFNWVEHFKYLRTIITEHKEVAKEVAVRIQTGNKCYYSLAKILGCRSLSRVNEQLYITLVRPIIMYGAETWPLRKLGKTNFNIGKENLEENCCASLK